MVGLAGAAQRVWLRDPAFRLRSHLLTLLAASGMALHSYRLAVLPLRRLSAYAREHAAVAPLPELLLANGSRAVGSLWREWHRPWLLDRRPAAAHPAVGPGAAELPRHPSQRHAGSGMAAVGLGRGPWPPARPGPAGDRCPHLPAFRAVLASAVLFSEAAVRRLVEERALPTRAQRDLAAPLLALVGSLAVTASSYAHAYGQQRRLEAVLLGQLGAGLDQIPADRWGQLRQIDCIGRLPRSPALAQAIRRFPCLGGGMVSPLVGNGAFGPMQLRSLTAIGLTYAPPTPERTARALAGQLPTLFKSRRFHAMQDGPVLVVVTR